METDLFPIVLSLLVIILGIRLVALVLSLLLNSDCSRHSGNITKF